MDKTFRLVEQDLIVPLGGGLSLTKLVAWSVPELSPEGSPMVKNIFGPLEG